MKWLIVVKNKQKLFYLFASYLPFPPILSKCPWVQWHDLKWLELCLTFFVERLQNIFG